MLAPHLTVYAHGAEDLMARARKSIWRAARCVMSHIWEQLPKGERGELELPSQSEKSAGHRAMDGASDASGLEGSQRQQTASKRSRLMMRMAGGNGDSAS